MKHHGWRTADLLISADKGQCEKVAKSILSEFSDFIVTTSIRIGSSELNVMAKVLYGDSHELHWLIEEIRAMPLVKSVEWYEKVEVFDSNKAEIVDRLFNRHRKDLSMKNL